MMETNHGAAQNDKCLRYNLYFVYYICKNDGLLKFI